MLKIFFQLFYRQEEEQRPRVLGSVPGSYADKDISKRVRKQDRAKKKNLSIGVEYDSLTD